MLPVLYLSWPPFIARINHIKRPIAYDKSRFPSNEDCLPPFLSDAIQCSKLSLRVFSSSTLPWLPCSAFYLLQRMGPPVVLR
jgi:hypothetical protein